ncbi:MAG: quinone oxidoreductase [Gammaproteobacteria bacterium]|nr:quinone oxidoreductase [Gammaproteobacteria bacterium]NIR83055.1 quinone oxidoreductase [Gammaproteobacteria bacterium]NIR90717.1 quinone oxidoreductase [Gammaproteobacteria bacterium]NIU04208.1 quinone oxidoreductase [Gammaproteobacteria bacterium]NIV51500.1 NADPH:quinone reductase [Gammaproteobacteria bacterium]
MSKAIRIHETGGPEVLRWEDVSVPEPGEGEVLVRHTAVGLNYIDVYFRTGAYSGPALPFTPGLEAAGVVESVGAGVSEFSAGDRVAYASAPMGAYAEQRIMPAGRIVRIPDGIDERRAAGMMLKGMTAEYLLRRTYRVQSGETILFHAAAGGVGLIACQWARDLGATVIGTVGSDEKAELAAAHGCTHPIVYTREDLVGRVKEITDGKGVPVVYDSVGRDTFERSLDCLQPRGTMVSFGQSSGKVAPFDVTVLSAKGSLYLTRPTIVHYTAGRDDLVQSASALFDVVQRGAVRIEVNQTFPLEDAADAHRALEARRTTGSTVLLP